MKKNFLFIFIFFLSVSGVFAGNRTGIPDMRHPAHTVRFMDYNVENGFWTDQYNGYDRFVNWISGNAPDVLAICEAATHKDRNLERIPKGSGERFLPEHLEELAQRWGHSHVAVGPYKDNYPVAVTSRYPIQVVQKISDGLCHGALHVKIRGVNYVVLHTWPLGGSKKDRRDGGGDRERYLEIKLVLDRTINNPEFKKERYWVLAGDLNSRSRLDEAHYRSVGLHYNYDAMDAALEAFGGNDVMWKFNGGRYVASLPTGFARIDYIYANGALYDKVFRAETIKDEFTQTASDHLPVMMEFEDVVEPDERYLHENICIVPKPVSVVPGKGFFRWTDRTVLYPGEACLRNPASVFAAQVGPALGHVPQVLDEEVAGAVTLTLDSALEQEEYLLEVRKSCIKLTGGSPQGVFHGLQTLRQVLLDGRVRCMTVKDKPCLAYRGTMLDVSRHFFSVEDVKRFIDILSLHKINTFHWHLTDDQGWRIEIKKYPELTNTGAFRKETLIGINRDGGVYDGMVHGGYYTRADMEEVVKYASDRFITVVPEIEMPGHGMGALTSYPWLGCTGGPYHVWTKWGVSKDVYCAGKESTFEFLEDVLTEVLEIFPSEYIHIGGDECPKDRWRRCPLCQQRIKAEGLKNEHQLQGYFIRRIALWLEAHGRKLIGWDEILDGGIDSSATIMTWRDSHNAVRAAWKGHDVILTPKWYCYMDYAQTSDPERLEPLCGTRFLPVEQVYRLDPYDKLKPEFRHHVLGVQANVWCEYVPDMKAVQYRLLPRLAALSEVGWACDRKDFPDFCNRAKALLPRLYRTYGYSYAPYFFSGQDLTF